MHVGVEKAVAEHLGEEDLDAGARERRDVDALLPQRVDLRYRRAVHALHHHHAPRAVVPVDRGHREQRRIREIAPQLRGVGGLAHQVQLVLEVARELGHHLARLQPPPVGPQPLHQPRRGLEQQHVLRDHRRDARPQHLDRDLGAVRQRARDAPGRRRRWRPAASRNSRTPPRRACRARFDLADGQVEGNGGTWSCSFASSSAMSAGSRSRRVDSTWPNLTKIGPSASSAWRRRTARGVRIPAAREPRHEAVQAKAHPDVQYAEQAQQVSHLSPSRSMRFSSLSRPSRSCACAAAMPCSSPRVTKSCFSSVAYSTKPSAARRAASACQAAASLAMPRGGAPPRRRRIFARSSSASQRRWRNRNITSLASGHFPRRRSRAAGGPRPSARRRARRGRK